MKSEIIIFGSIIATVVWLMPLVTYAIRHKGLRRSWRHLVARFKRQSFVSQLFLILFVSVFILRGGSKTTGIQSRQMNSPRASAMVQNEDGNEEENPLADDSLTSTYAGVNSTSATRLLSPAGNAVMLHDGSGDD